MGPVVVVCDHTHARKPPDHKLYAAAIGTKDKRALALSGYPAAAAAPVPPLPPLLRTYKPRGTDDNNSGGGGGDNDGRYTGRVRNPRVLLLLPWNDRRFSLSLPPVYARIFRLRRTHMARTHSSRAARRRCASVGSYDYKTCTRRRPTLVVVRELYTRKR